jgi:hypothetical protein
VFALVGHLAAVVEEVGQPFDHGGVPLRVHGIIADLQVCQAGYKANGGKDAVAPMHTHGGQQTSAGGQQTSAGDTNYLLQHPIPRPLPPPPHLARRGAKRARVDWEGSSTTRQQSWSHKHTHTPSPHRETKRKRRSPPTHLVSFWKSVGSSCRRFALKYRVFRDVILRSRLSTFEILLPLPQMGFLRGHGEGGGRLVKELPPLNTQHGPSCPKQPSQPRSRHHTPHTPSIPCNTQAFS